MSRALVPVLGMPGLDPGIGRVDMDVIEGSTILEIVAVALRTSNIDVLARTRVALVTAAGAVIVPQAKWATVRPKAGVQVVIRVVPGKAALRSILQVIVSIAAVALGQYWAVGVGGALGISTGTAQALITAGIGFAGNLLINALIPLPKPGTDEKRDTYTITGWKNEISPNGTVPDTFGTMRRAPPFAVLPYTEIVGDWQYVRAAFLIGYGDVDIEDHQIGDTDFSKYDEIQIEVREGLATDQPLTLTPSQILEESVGSELTRPRQRDDEGEVIDDLPPIETPVTRFTAADVATISVILGWPAGLFKMDDEGERKTNDVSVRIRQRLVGTDTWTEVVTLDINADKQEAMYRQHTWSPSARGRYEVEVTRMTIERLSPQSQDRTVWISMQSIRPEYPINMPKPMALVAVRIKATHQLNGSLDNYNALVKRRCLDWDQASSTWVKRASRNPAALFRYALQSDANAYPVSDIGIDLDALADWHDFCRLKGLEFSEEVTTALSLDEMLRRIAAAGRASPRHDGIRWSVVIDRPQALSPVDHISPRNSDQFRWSRSYFDPPDAFRVSFRDETNDYKPSERVVPWIGHTGQIKVTEEIELAGKTNPNEIWIAARRRMYELIHRPDQYSCIQDGAVRTATRGDLVMGSFDTLDRTQVAARVTAVRGRYIVIDEDVEMEEGKSYAVRFRAGLTAEDTVGISVVRQVSSVPGVWGAVTLLAGDTLPTEGHIIFFGELATESRPLIVAGVEAGEDFSGFYHLLDAAPQIDTLTDAEVPPAWDGRVGDEIEAGLVAPSIPRITSIRTGYNAADDVPTDLKILLSPGTGNAVPPSIFTIYHRLGSSGVFTAVTVPQANGGAKITGYARGDSVQLYATATSAVGVESDPTQTIAVIIGQRDTTLPKTPTALRVDVSGTVATPSMRVNNDANTVAVYFKRGLQSQSFEDAVRIGENSYLATGNQTVAIDDPGGPGYGHFAYWFVSLNAAGNMCLLPGRVDVNIYGPDIVTNGAFASDTAWTKTGGTLISGGVASHPAGASGGVSQAVTATAGQVFEITYTITSRSAGSMTARLAGTTTNIGAARTAIGTYTDTLTVPAGSVSLTILFSSDAVMAIDNVSMKRIG